MRKIYEGVVLRRGAGSYGCAVDAKTAYRHDRSILLDCIRGVAIIAVIFYHVTTRFDQTDLDPVAALFRRYGLLGVDIFFPLSGFLITGFLLRSHLSGKIKIFFQRRFFRIVPLYLVAVTFFYLAVELLSIEGEDTSRIWVTYLFLTGWFMLLDSAHEVPYTITWSLSVEEFAYILFGLVALWSLRLLPAFLIVATGAAVFLRIWLNLGLGEPPGVYNFPPARLDSIALGGITAVLLQRGVPGLGVGLFLITCCVFLFAIANPVLWSSLKYTFIATGTCSLVVLFETGLRGRGGRSFRWLASIGFYSYFTYLFHIFNIELTLRLNAMLLPDVDVSVWLVFAVVLVLTQVQALISFRFFEAPLIAYGRSLEEKPKSS